VEHCQLNTLDETDVDVLVGHDGSEGRIVEDEVDAEEPVSLRLDLANTGADEREAYAVLAREPGIETAYGTIRCALRSGGGRSPSTRAAPPMPDSARISRRLIFGLVSAKCISALGTD